jgi:hypothetical protein
MNKYSKMAANARRRWAAATALALVGCGSSDAARTAAERDALGARIALRSLAEDDGHGSDLVRRSLLAVEALRLSATPEALAALWLANDELPLQSWAVSHGAQEVPTALAATDGCGAAVAWLPASGLWGWEPGSEPKRIAVPAFANKADVELFLGETAAEVVLRSGCEAAVVSPAGVRTFSLGNQCNPSTRVALARTAERASLLASDGCTLERFDLATGQRVEHSQRAQGCTPSPAVAVDSVDGWVAAIVGTAASSRLEVWRNGQSGVEQLIVADAPFGAALRVSRHHLEVFGDESAEAGGELTRGRVFDLRSGAPVVDELAPSSLSPEWRVDGTGGRILFRTTAQAQVDTPTHIEGTFVDGEPFAAARAAAPDLFLAWGFVNGDGPAFVARRSGTWHTLSQPSLPRSGWQTWDARAELPQPTAAVGTSESDSCLVAWGQSTAVLVDLRSGGWAVSVTDVEATASDVPDVWRSPGGRWKTVYSPNTDVQVLETATERAPDWPELPAPLRSVGYGGKDAWLAAGFSDGTVRVWDGAPGSAWRVLATTAARDNTGVISPAFAAWTDRDALVVYTAELGLHTVYAATGEVMQKHDVSGPIVAFALHPAAPLAAVAKGNGAVELRSWPHWKLTARVVRSEWPVRAVWFSEDGKSVEVDAASTVDGAPVRRLLRALFEPEALSALVCSKLSRNLTRGEWTDAFGKTRYRETCPGLPVFD